MGLLYTFFLSIGVFAYKVLGIFQLKASQRINGAKQSLKIVAQKPSENPRIWIHCASLGEFEQAIPILETLRKEKPETKLILSFFSPSGYNQQKDNPLVDEVYYLPWDFYRDQKKFITAIQPSCCLLVKYEFWPRLMQVLVEKNIPVISISSRFFDNQIYFRSWGKWFLSHLGEVDHFFVQDENSKQLLATKGIDQVSIVGDTRMDRVTQLLTTTHASPKIDALHTKAYVVLGSSWPEDEILFWPLIERFPQWTWVVAPHDISEKRLESIQQKSGLSWHRWSRLQAEQINDVSFILVDSMGELKHIYAAAQWAYVGGGMGTKGLHNILEAGVYGIPVLIGKNYNRFQEAVDLIAAKGVFSVKDSSSLEQLLVEFSKNPEFRRETGTINKEFIRKNEGASALILEYLQKHYA